MFATNLLLTPPSIFKFPTNSISNSIYHKCSSYLSSEFITGKPNFSPRKRGLMMGERVIKIPALGSGSGDGDENIRVFEQENLIDSGSSQFPLSDFESTLNRLSKWLVSVIFGALILWRHDPEAVWFAMGSVLNSALSVALKRVLNQERPASIRRSDPGMPSSHAQSIFFVAVCIVVSMVEWLGVNEFTLISAAVTLAAGSYFSWLRIAQRFHTVSQVVVGAVLGFCFSVLWVWSWDAIVDDAFASFLWVRIAILLGSTISCAGFLVYVVLNWFADER